MVVNVGGERCDLVNCSDFDLVWVCEWETAVREQQAERAGDTYRKVAGDEDYGACVTTMEQRGERQLLIWSSSSRLGFLGVRTLGQPW
jgi:hypothetical protein